ncbi:YdcF family protein [Planctomycetota bacterium]
MFLVKSLATPIVWGLTLLILGLVLTRHLRKERRFRISWFIMLLGVLFLLSLSLRPVANILVYSLECQYNPASSEILKMLDTVVVLGAGSHSSGGLRTEAELSGTNYSRLYSGVKAFKQSNANLLGLCGGRSIGYPESDAEVMKAVAVYMGVPSEEILTETQSKNTMENAVRLAALLPEGEKRCIGLVTSAIHMLRAEKVFRKQFSEYTIVPIPTNYIYDKTVWSVKSAIPSVGALEKSTIALHEWIGILWYSLRYR